MSGADFLHAMILGVEVECRIGNAVYPAHYDRGWHITGTAGVFGAAAACGKALGLTEQQMVWALGLAATQPVGLREMFGSMTKSFHPGRAAQNGLTAALLAAAQLHEHGGRPRSEERLGQRAQHHPQLPRDHRQARRQLRDRPQHLQAVCVRHRHPPDHRCLRPVAQPSTP